MSTSNRGNKKYDYHYMDRFPSRGIPPGLIHSTREFTSEGQDVHTFHTIGRELGVPSTFTKLSENTLKYSIAKGQLNKLNLRSRINNEHCESSRTVQGTVTSTNIVGQVFRASKDNISGLSLTLESAAGATLDNFESYADSSALQVAWVESNASNPATLETVIVKPNSTKSMKVPMSSNGDEWEYAMASTDYTDFTGEFDYYRDNSLGLMEVYISDGTNSKSFELPVTNSNEWFHFEVNEAFMTEDQAGTTDVTAIVAVGFRVATKRSGASSYIDNLQATPPPGEIELKLWDMGATQPVLGTNSIDDGTQFTKLNGVDSSVMIPLRGGKRLYHIHTNFNAGVYKNSPTNELLTIGNYYLLQLNYVDTNVDVYGPDPSFATDYYQSGYAFTAASEAALMTSIGPYADVMFIIQSMQDIYITEVEFRLDAEPNGGSDLSIFLEDNDMNITDVVVDHEEQPEQKEFKDLTLRPMYLLDGGKCEFYYNDDYTDAVSTAVLEVAFLYEPSNPNG